MPQLLWIHDRARAAGGAENYLRRVVPALRALNLRSSLLYEPGFSEPDFLGLFDQAWPAVDATEQIRCLRPDLLFLQRLPRGLSVAELAKTGVPMLRMFHDHQPFCLREHKYTALNQQTCTRRLSWRCYTRCGPLVRASEGLALRSVKRMQQELAEHQLLAASLTGSDYLRGHLLEHGFTPERVHMIPLFAEGPSRPLPPGDPHELLFVGQLVTGKGLDLLLQAIAELPEVRLTIAGSGRQAERYRDQARLLGERVRFVGSVDSVQLQALYARAGVVVMPSRAPETFGLSGLEALAQGRAVIASEVGGVSTWLKPEVTGLSFASGDVRGLKQAICRLLNEPGLATRLGMQGQALWHRRFRLEHYLQALVPLLESLIPSKQSLVLPVEELSL